MTEEEWLNGQEVFPLADHLRRARRLNRTKIGRRKFWLLACACHRRVRSQFETDSTLAAVVAAAERFAEGEVQFAEVQNLCNHLNLTTNEHGRTFRLAARCMSETNPFNAAVTAAGYSAFASAASAVGLAETARDLGLSNEFTRIWSLERAQSIYLLRCIFGNPFRPVTLDRQWLTSTVVALARGIYEDRAFDRLPILADALQDAGCDSDDVLSHCRDAGPHARGCWVVDMVLGKS